MCMTQTGSSFSLTVGSTKGEARGRAPQNLYQPTGISGVPRGGRHNTMDPKRGSTYEIGSVARAEAMEIGDVDLLVEFDGP